MKTFQKGATAWAALAFALWVGGAQGVAGQVTQAAARPAADRSTLAYRQTLAESLAFEIESLRSVLLGPTPRENEMAEHTATIVTTAKMLGVLSPRTSAGEAVTASTYGARAEALLTAAERLDEAARAGDRAVALGHLQIVVRTFGAFQATFGTPPAAPRPVDATVNVD